MPYIITIRTERGTMTDTGWQYDDTRTAVATLDEAREHIVRAVAGTSKRQSVLDDARWTYADKLPESGGTIGPLPDGTVIEVRRVMMPEIMNGANLSRRDTPFMSDAAILAAFNAA